MKRGGDIFGLGIMIIQVSQLLHQLFGWLMVALTYYQQLPYPSLLSSLRCRYTNFDYIALLHFTSIELSFFFLLFSFSSSSSSFFFPYPSFLFSFVCSCAKTNSYIVTLLVTILFLTLALDIEDLTCLPTYLHAWSYLFLTYYYSES